MDEFGDIDASVLGAIAGMHCSVCAEKTTTLSGFVVSDDWLEVYAHQGSGSMWKNLTVAYRTLPKRARIPLCKKCARKLCFSIDANTQNVHVLGILLRGRDF